MTAGLRARKKNDTRVAIERAAVHLVSEFGLENVTIEAIAGRADVTSRTFFNHFADKEDALLGAPRDRVSVIPAVEIGIEGDRDAAGWAIASVRAGFAAVDDGFLAFDQLRRDVLRTYPELLHRQFDSLGAAEEILTTMIEERYKDTSRREARAISFFIGAAVRLAIEEWCRASSEPIELVAFFDLAVVAITHVGQNLEAHHGDR